MEQKDIEKILSYINDNSELVKACHYYYEATNSTAAFVNLIRLREFVNKFTETPNKTLNLTGEKHPAG